MVLSKKITKKDGFTLFEIMIAIAILGGLLALFLPMYRRMQTRGEIQTAKLTLGQIRNAISLYKTDIGEYPSRLQDLVRKPTDAKAAAKWLSAYAEESLIEKEEIRYRKTPGGKHPYELTITLEDVEEPISAWK